MHAYGCNQKEKMHATSSPDRSPAMPRHRPTMGAILPGHLLRDPIDPGAAPLRLEDAWAAFWWIGIVTMDGCNWVLKMQF